MIKLSKSFLILFLINLLVSNVALADTTQYRIQNSNLYCVNGNIGPKLFVVVNDAPSEISFTAGIEFYQKEIKKVSKQLKTLKAKLKKAPKDKKLKAKQKKLNANNKLYASFVTSIKECRALAPIVVEVAPVSTPAPTAIPELPPVYVSNSIPIESYYLYEGAGIYASDGEYLGIFSTNKFLYESIANSFGLYGSSFQYKSVFNDFSPYGSAYSAKSAWNPYSSTPPILYFGTEGVAYFTRNVVLTPRIDPALFLAAVGR